MKNSKIAFAIITSVVLVICVILLLLRPGQEGPDNATSATDPFDNTLAATEGAGTQATLDLSNVEIPTLPEETTAPIIVGNNITIQKVDKDPNEIIDRSPQISPEDPEYIPVTGGDPYFNEEGKVCRNDKIITISLYDPILEEPFTVSFGYITGACNRFLYLNPIVKRNGETEPSYILFNYPILGGGYQITISGTEGGNKTYSYSDTRDNTSPAEYIDPRYPGAVWFPKTIVEGPVYLDMILSNQHGQLIATLRLTIDKAEDGTYSLADIDNLDMIQNPDLHSEFTETELEYVVKLANEAWLDPQRSKILDNSIETGFSLSQCIIEYREPISGLYYTRFVPAEDTTDETKAYADLAMPILAVTFRKSNTTSYTLYFLIIYPPGNGQHGSYQYIGRDHPLF